MNSYIGLHDIAQRGCLSGTCHGVCGVSRQVGHIVPVPADFLASIQGIFRGVPALEGPYLSRLTKGVARLLDCRLA